LEVATRASWLGWVWVPPLQTALLVAITYTLFGLMESVCDQGLLYRSLLPTKFYGLFYLCFVVIWGRWHLMNPLFFEWSCDSVSYFCPKEFRFTADK